MPDATLIEYAVDPLNRRVGRKVNGVWTNRWLYQGGVTPVAEIDSLGTVVARYIYGIRENVPEAVIRGGVTYRIITDDLGSVVMLVNSSGSVTATRTYSTFGEVATRSGTMTEPFGFGGGIADSVAGLVHLGARDYDPLTGLWLTPDPVGFAGGDVNVYRYVGGDPVSSTDPFGLSGWLTIYSSTGPESSMTGGHSWISYRQDGGPLQTYGTWGWGSVGTGLYSNREAGRPLGDGASRSVYLNDQQERNLFDTIEKYKFMGHDAWGYSHPCSSFAQDAWRAATGENPNANGPYSNPTTLKTSIEGLNASDYNASHRYGSFVSEATSTRRRTNG